VFFESRSLLKNLEEISQGANVTQNSLGVAAGGLDEIKLLQFTNSRGSTSLVALATDNYSKTLPFRPQNTPKKDYRRPRRKLHPCQNMGMEQKMKVGFRFLDHINEFPRVIARTEVGRITGGLISPKTLANLDSKGEGPPELIRVGRRVGYPSESFLGWLDQRIHQGASSRSGGQL
jgi:hypothetical protein